MTILFIFRMRDDEAVNFPHGQQVCLRKHRLGLVVTDELEKQRASLRLFASLVNHVR